MANRTDSWAEWKHGFNPQYLISKIVRGKIYDEAYWKEYCFALNAETLIDEAAKLDYVCGTYGGRRRPAKFLCLFNKLLQIQPDEDVILEYIKQPEMKYLRVLGAAYLRMVGSAMTIHQTLEPLFADYRKLRWREMDGTFKIIHVDEFVDWLLTEDYVFDCAMPVIPKREVLEESDNLPKYISPLEDDLEDFEANIDELAGESTGAGAAEGDAADEDARRSRSASRHSERRRRSASGRRRRSSSRQRSVSAKRPRRKARSASSSKRRSRSAKRRSASPPQKRRRSASPARRRRSRSASPPAKAEKKKDKKEKKEKKEKKDKKREKEKEPVNKAQAQRDAGYRKKNGADEGPSVDEWNEIRKNLGIKPLKK